MFFLFTGVSGADNSTELSVVSENGTTTTVLSVNASTTTEGMSGSFCH